MEEIREKYNSGESSTREAFEELCAMVERLEVISFRIEPFTVLEYPN